MVNRSSASTQQQVAAKARDLLAGRVQAAVDLSAAGDLVDERQEQARVAQEAAKAARSAYEASYAAALRQHGWSTAELAELGCRSSRGTDHGGRRRSLSGSAPAAAAAPRSGQQEDAGGEAAALPGGAQDGAEMAHSAAAHPDGSSG